MLLPNAERQVKFLFFEQSAFHQLDFLQLSNIFMLPPITPALTMTPGAAFAGQEFASHPPLATGQLPRDFSPLLTFEEFYFHRRKGAARHRSIDLM